MKKSLQVFPIVLLCLSLLSCGGKESASSIAKKWCELNGKAYKAADGPEKEAAKAAVDKFEKEMEDKYKKDEAFMKEIGKEVEKCEDASEGRK